MVPILGITPEQVNILFFALVLPGCVGGFVRAIVQEDDGRNQLTLPGLRDGKLATGFLGDVIAGGASAIAAYSFFGIAGGFAMPDNMEIVRLMGFGIVAGYAGVRLLNIAVDDMLKKRIVKAEGKAAAASLLADGARLAAKNQYSLAAERFRSALALDPTDISGQVNLAICVSYLGAAGEKEALDILEEVVNKDPQHDEAWYNIACIRSIATFRQMSADEVLEPLAKAIALRPATWKEYIKSDIDFDRFRNGEFAEAKYYKLTGDPNGAPIAK